MNHYLIQSRLLTLSSRNSIRQIGGVWTSLAWPVAGRRATTLDAQLDTAARRYLASGEGLRLSGSTLSVSEPASRPSDVAEPPAGSAGERDHADVQAPAASRHRFDGERADRDHILRRA
ncbi:MAG: hypothetical protein EXQ51_12610, partial [Acidobacteria bacterium]|nr:hypothetical protein [Acidobacteriota bacterium]